MKKAKRAIVIGFDAPIVKSIRKYIKEGKMPNVSKLVGEGVWAENCLVPHPTITPPNWTTIATGAWLGTHSITCFNVHKPGDPLDKIHQGFLTEDCKAEYIWNAAADAGFETILLNYPSTWPNAVKKGIQIAGAGLGVNKYRDDEDYPGPFYTTLGADLFFSTEEYPESTSLNFRAPSGWRNLHNKNGKEAELKISLRLSKMESREPPWYLLLQDTTGKGFEQVIISREKDTKKAFATLKVGQWSEKLYQEIETDKGRKRIVFKIKLVELSSDGSKVRLYFTPLCALEGFSSPPEIAKELEMIEGLPLPNSFYSGYHFEWFDLDTLIELIQLQNLWFAEAAHHLLSSHPWTLFFMHAHCPDHSYHAFINKLEQASCKDKEVVSRHLKAEAGFYESLDRMVGRILEVIDEETVVVITSDHGAVPTRDIFESDFHHFNVEEILKNAGLLTIRKDELTGKDTIDWSKTKAVPQRSVYIYVNLKDRDPDGIVEPKDYEKVQNEIIKVLYDYTDPKTGKKPIAFALKKQDARIIGLYGDYIGDVVYGINPEVSGEHGRQLPTGEWGMGSMKGLFIISGPGIKKNFALKRTIWLTDIVPTLCYLMDLPVPKDTEGAVIYQAFEDHDFKRKEIETLRRNYERMRKAISAERRLTHNY